MARQILLSSLIIGFLWFGNAIPASGRTVAVVRDTPITSAMPAPNKVITRIYEYYPESHVYFSPGAKKWFWLEDRTWRSGPAIPSYISLRGMRKSVLIDSDIPYINHEYYIAPGVEKKETRPAVNLVNRIVLSNPKRYEYIYYPEFGVYFDQSNHQYLWVENGTWLASYTLPPILPHDIQIGEPILVDRDVLYSVRP